MNITSNHLYLEGSCESLDKIEKGFVTTQVDGSFYLTWDFDHVIPLSAERFMQKTLEEVTDEDALVSMSIDDFRKFSKEYAKFRAVDRVDSVFSWGTWSNGLFLEPNRLSETAMYLSFGTQGATPLGVFDTLKEELDVVEYMFVAEDQQIIAGSENMESFFDANAYRPEDLDSETEFHVRLKDAYYVGA